MFAPNSRSASRTFSPMSSSGAHPRSTAIDAAMPAACPIEQTGGMTRMLLCSAWSTEIARQPISRFFTDGGTMQPYGIS